MSKIRPSHYRGEMADGTPIQAVDVGEAFGLCHHKSTAVEYIIRSGKKDGSPEPEDLAKAKWWLDRRLDVIAVEAARAVRPEPDPTSDPVLQEVAAELQRATLKHPPMRSPHEAWGIIAEEFTELTEEIRRQKPDREGMRHECVQLAAMAIRLIKDVCPEPMTDTEAVPDAQLTEAFERVALRVSREAGGDITPAAAAQYLRRRFADPAMALEELESVDSIDVIEMAEEIANEFEAAD